jgi:hypothetical protein
MGLLTSLITLVVLISLVASGVIFNTYLYSNGALGIRGFASPRRWGSTSIGKETLPDKEMSNYVRKSVAILLGVALAVLVIVALVLSTLQ